MTLRATARLQFQRDFPLDRGTELIPYFARLGISHLYASPLLKARPGSTHGYDIVDHSQINPELGGEDALRRMVGVLREHRMGLILDIVPNHMSVGGVDNVWWLDVLEWGRNSDYAEFFDIDWDPPDPTLRGKVLAPFLGGSYGDALEAGDLKLRFDPEDGRFVVEAYGAHRFPIAPRDYAEILRAGGGGLDVLAERFADPGPGGRAAVRKRMELSRETLRAYHADHPEPFATAVAAYDPAASEGRERLHKLLERQNYRVAWWRAASDDINWRRFFDINSLAGIRVERPEVFDATHATVLRLYAEGMIDGVRVDHVDGLADPRGYCRKLRRKLETAHAGRPDDLKGDPPLIYVEKILFAHEQLPKDWLTDGTTGYDFMNDVGGVLHDPSGEAKLTELWTTMTGRPAAFEDEAKPARRQILRQTLSSELNGTTAALLRFMRRDLKTRDWTQTAIRRSLEELLIHFHAYRIYAGLGGASETDKRDLAWAMAGARRTVRPADTGLLEHLGYLLAGEGIRETPAGAQRQERLRAMVRFQQLSAPVAAKAIEDTAFYRYGRLLSRNEVGSEPSQFAISPGQFHAIAGERQKRYPRALRATATHDHKRGEDTRVRLAVLSEIPDAWEQALTRWTRLNAPFKREVDGTLAPDVADEVMLYQTIVSAWPLGLEPDDAEALAAYRNRVAGWLEKAAREAKRRSEWAAPNEAYERACQEFLGSCLDSARTAPITREFAGFAARIAPAGAMNGLSQTLLRLTVPGVPDLYQGTEFWDLSLVDPDNRRSVDYDSRRAALEANESPSHLAASWPDGRVKLAVIARTLAARSRTPELWAAGSYQRLKVEGPCEDNILAFARVHGGKAAIVVASRLATKLLDPDGTGETSLATPIHPRAEVLDGTTINLPRSITSLQRFSDVLGDRGDSLRIETGSGQLQVGDLLSTLPIALLEVG
ncbi:MAG TPA: malto-oligosyltrehalose synthase [Acetobacteraceae bacterium]|jgi:(1->4)-alpha-D-glucan 1-alpha-D-glucosylmutase|nr:malto-oligosyltrehalose synthase [Acetobacteraceae bacterium]